MITDIIPSGFRAIAPWRRRGEFADLQRSMSQLMRDFFDEEPSLLPSLEGDGSFMPRLGLEETDEKIILSAELPGLNEKDVEVSVDKDYLTLKGEKREEKESKGAGRSTSERRYGTFERTVRLPESADREKISAKFDKGVLTVEVPKTPEAKSEIKKIAIKH
jgi:HSP20 family protein